MKEEFLHYVWQYKLFSSTVLFGTKKEEINIIKSGMLNTNSGPDFLNAQLIIDGLKWVGNIEIHLKSSDWYRHNHENDVNYDAVVLHVVYEDDVEIFMKNNNTLPTLVLKDKITIGLLSNYEMLFKNTSNWIPCEKDIQSVSSFVLNNWFERLYLERLKQKSTLIERLLLQSKNNYEAVLFQLLAKNFGMIVNADAFLNLAKSVSFSVIRKERFHEENLLALLFGQAGFLEENLEDKYHKKLKVIYIYQQNKYKLKPLDKNQFQFFRMRPNNFPTIRIAQLVALYLKHQSLFSKLIEEKKVLEMYDLFNIDIPEFWKNHYTFEKAGNKSSKKITKSFINLVLINTVIPLKFVYERERNQFNIDDFLKLIIQLPSEKNSIITKFLQYKIKADNAFQSQALLQLKNEYCNHKKCLKCAIGSTLLKNNI